MSLKTIGLLSSYINRRVFGFTWLFLGFSIAVANGGIVQQLSVHNPALTLGLHRVDRLAATNQLRLAIALPLRNQEVLTNLLRELYDPQSPNYRHYLTPEQFTAQFGPSQEDYDKVIAFARANGLRVTKLHPNRVLVDVEGAVPDIEKALNVTMGVYDHPAEKRQFYAPDQNPSLALTTKVISIGGLNNFAIARPRLVSTPIGANQTLVAPNGGSGPSSAYMGNDFRAAYVPGTALTGSGQMVGLLQFDGYSASDITTYETMAGIPNVPLENILIDGASGNPSLTGGEVEVCLDIEMAISMAPGLSKVLLYIAPNPRPFEDLLNPMVNENRAKQLSCSWYIPGGGTNAATDQIFQQMAAQGQSFFNASGDSDAYTGLIDFPGDSPFITQVGGTTLSTTGPGGSFLSETVWNYNNGVGSGGGISTAYSIPYYQTNISMVSNQGSTTMRNIPDVALTADNIFIRADGGNRSGAGTSASAPLWAGFMALVNQQAALAGKAPVGFINAALTEIGNGTSYGSAFHDTKTGNNTKSSSPSKFFAVKGYDLCTGWGTPSGQNLINLLASPEPLLIKPATGFNSIGGVGGPFTVVTQNFSLTNSWTNSFTWTLSNTSIWLNATPISGTLNPGGPATTVVVTLNAAANSLAVGSYSATLRFTNVNDGVMQARQFSVTIIDRPTITVQPTNQTALDGATVMFAAQVTGGQPLFYQWQINSNNLAEGGSISGSTTTNVVVTNVTPALAGYYRMIVSNAAGLAVSSNALLTVPNSAPVIITQPASQTNYLGGTVQFSVKAIGSKPFFYQWNFNGTNIDGATNANLTLSNLQTTNAGNYAVTVTNLFGSTLSSNALLTINAAPPCVTPSSGMIGWFRAEGDAIDAASTNNGTIVGSVTFTNGEVGQAFAFNGVNGYVQVGTAYALNGSRTIEAWVFPRTNSGLGLPIFVGGPDRNDDFFGIAGTTGDCNVGQYRPYLDHYGTTCYNGGVAVTPNTWNHVAVVYNNNTTNGSTVTFFVNGQISAVMSGVLYNYDFNSCTIGGTANTSTTGKFSFNGGIDELSVYNRALTSNEIALIYNIGVGGKCFFPTPPLITLHPANQVVDAGDTAVFTVNANSTTPLFYQWSFNGAGIGGATNANLTLVNVQPTNAGIYAVVVTNIYGAAMSSNASLTVLTHPPVITTQPPAIQTANANAGENVSFTVVATGTPQLHYQWSFNTVDIPGATSTSLTLVNVQATDAGTYTVTVTNLYGSILSSNALLTVFTHSPVITKQPTNITVTAGSSAAFLVTATGTAPLIYQWNFNGTNIAGATNASLTLFNLQFTNAGNYAVTVTNLYGSILSSNGLLTVVTGTPCVSAPSGLVSWWEAEGNAIDSASTNNGTLMGGVTFTNGEAGQAFGFNGSNSYVKIGGSFSLSGARTVEAWVFPSTNTELGLPIFVGGPDHNDDFFGIAGTAGDCNVGQYRLYVDHYGTTCYNGGRTVTPFTWNHVAMVYSGSQVTFYVNGQLGATVSGTLFNYNLNTCTIGGTLNPGSTTKNYFNGSIDELSVYNRALTSNEIAAIYNAGINGKCPPSPPYVIDQPTNQTVGVGGTANFTVLAGGAPQLKYQWNFNGTNLSGANSATLTMTNVQFSNAGPYQVTITNNFGATNSIAAILTVTNVLHHFGWDLIPSPRFINTPFSVTISALDPTNGLYTNFIGTVTLTATNGIGVTPGVSSNFVQGVWSGSLSVSQLATGMVLRATSGSVFGLANPINIVAAPTIQLLPSSGSLLLFWPVAPAGFTLQYTPSLAPPNWINYPAGPLQVGNQYLITIPTTGTNAFYRLRFADP